MARFIPTAPPELWRLAFDALGVAALAVDARGVILHVNAAAERLVGKPSAACALTDVLALREENTGAAVDDPVRRCLDERTCVRLRCEARARRRNPVALVLEVAVSPLIADGEAVGAVAVLEDVRRMRDVLRVLEHRASHDALTSLVNREIFRRRLEELVQRMGGGDEHALLYLDLDGFKRVNDTLGHTTGDAVLREVAHVFRGVVRGRDTLARLGGDEFAVLLEHCPEAQAIGVAHELRDELRARRFGTDGEGVRIDLSIGGVVLDGVHRDAGHWIAEADRACYTAKRNGGGIFMLTGVRPADGIGLRMVAC